MSCLLYTLLVKPSFHMGTVTGKKPNTFSQSWPLVQSHIDLFSERHCHLSRFSNYGQCGGELVA